MLKTGKCLGHKNTHMARIIEHDQLGRRHGLLKAIYLYTTTTNKQKTCIPYLFILFLFFLHFTYLITYYYYNIYFLSVCLVLRTKKLLKGLIVVVHLG